MVYFFKKGKGTTYAVQTAATLTPEDIEKLTWLLDGARPLKARRLKGRFIGPRREMITPWSTNAVEMAANTGVDGIERIESFSPVNTEKADYDPMLAALYDGLDQNVFNTDRTPEPVRLITDIDTYDAEEGLALSPEEKEYLRSLSEKIGRPLTDSEIFGFSQVNSEHCRHKIFNGSFVIDGKEMPSSLFGLIKKTSKENPNSLVSAYKDNVAFLRGPRAMQFAPEDPAQPSSFAEKEIDTVISLKAETHNFPTTVEPFNGAATGSGGEIRDRLGGGRASLPIAGTAVYMTSYPRPEGGNRTFESLLPRPWLYQTPAQILIKASNGASDFGNKFGQPLIAGSVLTFEHAEHDRTLAYDKVIMLAGGVGFGTLKDAIKGTPEPGMKVVVMGGDNYRIGMGGGAVSSVDTGRYANAIELNAVQRANPEMQKRVSNVIRALAEMEENPCVSIHDHGAGGHLNALSELVEATGGHIDLDSLPIGDTTLSAKEIVGNESQERMGLVMREKDIDKVRRIADRERAPFYVVGETTDDSRFVFQSADGSRPIDLAMSDMFGSSPKTVMTDNSVERTYADPKYSADHVAEYLDAVLRLEAVACKDWLTNKVDRSVTGRVARQQCQGPLQLPLSDCGVTALDYRGRAGIATSIGHAPQAALIDPADGSRLSIAEALTNIAGARLKDGLRSVSLSANWMWPCRNEGEDARLYSAVKGCSDFACALGINIPTGKDSLSMTQKYPDGSRVIAPGTVIISAAGEVSDIRRTVSPVAKLKPSAFIYVGMSKSPFALGGSAFAQALGTIGSEAPRLDDPEYFARTFEAIQSLVRRRLLLAMHDVSAGGLAVTLLEMQFANTRGTAAIDLTPLGKSDPVKAMFAENPAVVLQVSLQHIAAVRELLDEAGVEHSYIGTANPRPGNRVMTVKCGDFSTEWDIDRLRSVWYETSWQMERLQTESRCADARRDNIFRQPVALRFPAGFNGKLKTRDIPAPGSRRPVAAIIREKGVNGDREMAWSLYMAGFDVRDVHMTDLTSGRETLDSVSMIVFCGGFSNSDVLGSAKGWAGAFKYNDKARTALERFYARPDTLSLGICNGCQLMIALGLIRTEGAVAPSMQHNVSGKFESEYVSLTIPDNKSVMLGSLAGSKLGIWVAHGEGRFHLPDGVKAYNVAAQYTYKSYPGNPNGSPSGVAALTSDDGRHLAMMPHLERALMPWQCGFYPDTRMTDDVTPWFDAFVNARKWIEANAKA